MNENTDRGFEIAKLENIDPGAVAAAESVKARIQAAYMMALKKPRNEDAARDKILKACRNPRFAERVEFSKPTGNKDIKGLSIRFAELALREWGNILCEVQILYEDMNTRRSCVQILDLETNASFSKHIQISKTVERKNAKGRDIITERINSYGDPVYVVVATEDEMATKENAQISKVLRNEGLRLIPADIKDEALDTAHETLARGDKTDPQAAKKKLLDKFSAVGVTPLDIETYLGHKTDVLEPIELQTLRLMYAAIEHGEASWRDYLRAKEEPEGAAGEQKPAVAKVTSILELQKVVGTKAYDMAAKLGMKPDLLSKLFADAGNDRNKLEITLAGQMAARQAAHTPMSKVPPPEEKKQEAPKQEAPKVEPPKQEQAATNGKDEFLEHEKRQRAQRSDKGQPRGPRTQSQPATAPTTAQAPTMPKAAELNAAREARRDEEEQEEMPLGNVAVDVPKETATMKDLKTEITRLEYMADAEAVVPADARETVASALKITAMLSSDNGNSRARASLKGVENLLNNMAPLIDGNTPIRGDERIDLQDLIGFCLEQIDNAMTLNA